MKRLLLALSMLACASSFASDNAAVVAFAKANADRFKNEISASGGLQIGSLVTLQGALDSLDMNWLVGDYDPDGARMRYTRTAQVRSLKLSLNCKQLGTFVGQNAFGAQVRARKEICDQTIAFGNRSASLAGAIKMSPAQYRRMKDGVRIEIDFRLAVGSDGTLVKFTDEVSPATITDRVETRARTWMIHGEIEEVRFQLPGEAQFTKIWPE